MNSENRKTVITAGEMSGVSAIIILKAFEHDVIKKIAPVIYGDKNLIEALQNKLVKEGRIKYQKLNIKDKLKAEFKLSQLKHPTPETGYAAGFYFEEAIKDALSGKIAAIATAPLDKDNLQKGGYNFTGHTTMLKRLTDSDDVVMMLYGKYLKVALLTIHSPLNGVSSIINKEKIIKTVKIVHSEFKSKFNIKNPKIGLLGLNPHAGENGKLGTEEIKYYIPAINSLKKEGISIEGPYPADTYFHSIYKKYDVTIASYHDQGLIPLKMLHFDDGVNITLGIPVIRTSVDHGTAYDIADNFDKASEKSLVEAVKEADRIANSLLKQ